MFLRRLTRLIVRQIAREPDLPLPGWPRPLPVGGATVAVFLVLAVVAAATGRDLRRRVNRR